MSGWGTPRDPRGRSRFRDCNFEGAGRAAAPREEASVTGHAVQPRRMRRRATVAAACRRLFQGDRTPGA